jgi:tRNA-uridine 2-sulfurtransferase
VRVLVAMSGGVDSSVAAGLLAEAGHEVVGATMKLWGGDSDSGCCSVADVEDARRVAEQLGIVYHVFNFETDFEREVVGPYVTHHAEGRTPNPCVECNRHLKFDRLLRRALSLGFDAVATGHHARVEPHPNGHVALRRGADGAKDQSYVLAVLGPRQLSRCLFPVGRMTKPEVRARAQQWGLRTAAKPDSQDVCFITSTEKRAGFLARRQPLRPGRLIEASSRAVVGEVEAVELVTVGQRRGLGRARNGRPRYALSVDTARGEVLVGSATDLHVQAVGLSRQTWTSDPLPPGTRVLAQCSAHGAAEPAQLEGGVVRFDEPRRRVAPGQLIALYDGDEVLGSGIAC